MKRLSVVLVVAVMSVVLAAVPAFAQSSRVFVTDVSPNGGSANVGAERNISATFDLRMARSTINSGTFYLKRQGSSAIVPAQVTYVGTTKTAKLNPNSALAHGATYTATIKGGQLGVKASGGALLGGTRDSTATFANGKVTWSFTVAKPPPSDTERPFLVNYDPAPGARNVPVDVSPKATVNESLRPDSVNTQGITMSEDTSPSQPVNIAVGYDENTKTISVDPIAELEDGTAYQVEISGMVDLAGNVQDGSQGWTFETGDATAPTVSSVAPTDGATGVATNTNIAAAFSEAMDASSITDQSFTLSKEDGSPVAAHVSYDTVSKKATLNPVSNLMANTTYEAAITTSVKDNAGNALARSYTWSFTIAPDTLPPTVSSVAPTNGATKVTINTEVMATFSEEMDSDTVTNQSFTLSKSGSPVPAQVTYDADSLTATLDPDQNLENGATYDAKITTTAKDLAGNAITQQKSWSFTTADPGVTFTFTPDPLPFTSDALCSPESKLLRVDNNGPGDVTFANVSITGPDAARFSTGAQRYLASNPPFTVLAGNYFRDEVTFVPEGGPPQPRTYSATLTYKDGTGATIGSPVTLSARTTCLVFG